MIRSRTLVTALLFGAFFSSLGTAQDLSKYRDFQFGMRLESVARQIHMDASAAKTTHKRPAVIQTLQWDQLSYSAPAAKDRSLRSIRFDFYNGELFKNGRRVRSCGNRGHGRGDLRNLWAGH